MIYIFIIIIIILGVTTLLQDTINRFIDSAQHLSTSLDKLVRNLTIHGTDRLNNLRDFINETYEGCETKLQLLSRKGVYPYSYIDSMERFTEGNDYYYEYSRHSNTANIIIFYYTSIIFMSKYL